MLRRLLVLRAATNCLTYRKLTGQHLGQVRAQTTRELMNGSSRSGKPLCIICDRLRLKMDCFIPMVILATGSRARPDRAARVTAETEEVQTQ